MEDNFYSVFVDGFVTVVDSTDIVLLMGADFRAPDSRGPWAIAQVTLSVTGHWENAHNEQKNIKISN